MAEDARREDAVRQRLLVPRRLQGDVRQHGSRPPSDGVPPLLEHFHRPLAPPLAAAVAEAPVRFRCVVAERRRIVVVSEGEAQFHRAPGDADVEYKVVEQRQQCRTDSVARGDAAACHRRSRRRRLSDATGSVPLRAVLGRLSVRSPRLLSGERQQVPRQSQLVRQLRHLLPAQSQVPTAALRCAYVPAQSSRKSRRQQPGVRRVAAQRRDGIFRRTLT